MAQGLFSEDICSLVAAYLLAHRRSSKGGRSRINDRATIIGILFVLKTKIPWEYLPRELGRGSGVTCRRGLHEWCLHIRFSMRAKLWIVRKRKRSTRRRNW